MITAKKSLGQNFLIDQDVINKIVNIIDIKDKKILEIGPGTGNLTSAILDKYPKKIIVVEKDDRLVQHLKNTFTNKIEVINSDILQVNENLIDEQILTVFGNLPYNISTEILCKWILNINNQKFWFDYLVLMFQQEVADRIISIYNSKDYGRLSILANWKLKVKKVFDIKPSSFSPKPKINSTVLLFEPKENFYKLKKPQNLEKITRIFFMHRRKMIKKPFNTLFEGKIEIAKKLGINLNLRPQNLDFETYYKLTDEFEKLRS